MNLSPAPLSNAERNRCIEMLGLHQPASDQTFNNVLALLMNSKGVNGCEFVVLYRGQLVLHGSAGSRPLHSHSYCSQAIDSGKKLVETDGNAAYVVSTPNGVAVGAVAFSKRQNYALSAEQKTAITQAGQIIESVIQYRAESGTDELTQLTNRRFFNKNLDVEWRRAQRNGSRLGIIMIDIDHFKLINDSFGHDAGDVCLQTVASVLASKLSRAGDLVARYGGEEFIVVTPDATPDSLLRCANKLRQAIESTDFLVLADAKVTLSAGASLLSNRLGDASHIEQAINRADQSLLRAKASGKNTVVVYDASKNTPQITEHVLAEAATICQ